MSKLIITVASTVDGPPDSRMAPTVELREITKDSLRAVLDLAVEPRQEAYVATNARSIAEAHFEPHAWFRAVYADDEPVGFVMAYRNPPTTFWVWRFMIDAGHQGKGYGHRALELLVEEARQDGVAEVKLSYHPGEHSPQRSTPASASSRPARSRRARSSCGSCSTSRLRGWRGDTSSPRSEP